MIDRQPSHRGGFVGRQRLFHLCFCAGALSDHLEAADISRTTPDRQSEIVIAPPGAAMKVLP